MILTYGFSYMIFISELFFLKQIFLVFFICVTMYIFAVAAFLQLILLISLVPCIDYINTCRLFISNDPLYHLYLWGNSLLNRN